MCKVRDVYKLQSFFFAPLCITRLEPFKSFAGTFQQLRIPIVEIDRCFQKVRWSFIRRTARDKFRFVDCHGEGVRVRRTMKMGGNGPKASVFVCFQRRGGGHGWYWSHSIRLHPLPIHLRPNCAVSLNAIVLVCWQKERVNKRNFNALVTLRPQQLDDVAGHTEKHGHLILPSHSTTSHNSRRLVAFEDIRNELDSKITQCFHCTFIHCIIIIYTCNIFTHSKIRQ